MTTQTVGTDVSWRSRPALSVGLRLLVYGTPIVTGTAVARAILPALNDSMSRLAATLTTLLAAVLVSLIVSRLTMRLMPLVVLLRMTMLFPDRAPSRLKVARRATSMREITRLLSSQDLTEHEAAETMLALVTALGRHDRRTRGHSERVRLFVDLLARELDLPAAAAGRLRWAALIHDIGKLEVAAAVLNKAGSLNAAEWRAIKKHPEAGAALAAPLADWLGPWFSGIAEHHERYDGNGYPLGLAGPDISVAGRAVAVVDAFETMTAARSYKSVRSTFAARAELTHCAGTHFDPAMVRAFLQIALPRLLWSVGPLAFVVNVPFLRWLGEGGARVADAAAATTATAASAAGVTAVAVAVGALPTGAAAAATTPHPAVVKTLGSTAAHGASGSALVGGSPVVQGGRAGSVGGLGGAVGSPRGGIGASGAGPTSSGSGSADDSPVSTVGSTVGNTVGSTAGDTVGKTVGDVGSTVGTVGGAASKTVDTVSKTVGGVTSTVSDTVGGIVGGLTGGSSGPSGSSGASGSGSGGSGSSGSGSSGSGSSGSGSSGSSSGSSGSGGGTLGDTVKGVVCTLPLGLCPDPSHTH